MSLNIARKLIAQKQLQFLGLRKITTLYYNDDLIKRLGKNARSKVGNFYNPESHYEQIIKLYGRVVDKKN